MKRKIRRGLVLIIFVVGLALLWIYSVTELAEGNARFRETDILIFNSIFASIVTIGMISLLVVTLQEWGIIKDGKERGNAPHF